MTGLGDRNEISTNEEEEDAVTVDGVAGVDGRGNNLQGYGGRIRGESVRSTQTVETEGMRGEGEKV
jgi:hypothetical protein